MASTGEPSQFRFAQLQSVIGLLQACDHGLYRSLLVFDPKQQMAQNLNAEFSGTLFHLGGDRAVDFVNVDGQSWADTRTPQFFSKRNPGKAGGSLIQRGSSGFNRSTALFNLFGQPRQVTVPSIDVQLDFLLHLDQPVQQQRHLRLGNQGAEVIHQCTVQSLLLGLHLFLHLHINIVVDAPILEVACQRTRLPGYVCCVDLVERRRRNQLNPVRHIVRIGEQPFTHASQSADRLQCRDLCLDR